jgi:hypothetical protein
MREWVRCQVPVLRFFGGVLWLGVDGGGSSTA